MHSLSEREVGAIALRELKLLRVSCRVEHVLGGEVRHLLGDLVRNEVDHPTAIANQLRFYPEAQNLYKTNYFATKDSSLSDGSAE